MRIRTKHLSLATLIALSCASGAWSQADLFSKYSLDQAKQKAQMDGRLLLIDFTATWCPPCKKMEAATWTDSAVQAWIRENAIAVQIDVDKDKKSTTALNVEAMPTLVLFTPKGGASEFGRQVGFMSPAELLRWLEGAKSGKSSDKIEKEEAKSQGEDAWAHISKARELQTAGQNAGALEQYVWLWSNTGSDDHDLAAIRDKMVPLEMKKLCAALPAAKTKVSEMRDAADKADNRRDWMILNEILDDNARTITWFDKIKTDPRQSNFIKKNTDLLERVLYSKSRWADAADFLYADPLVKIDEMYKQSQDMKKPRPDTEVSQDFDPFASMVLMLYGAYVGAGREAEAKKIEDECLRLDDTPGMHTGLANMAKGMRLARDLKSKAGN